jgi:parallel beta-helix repeat protein
VVSGAQIGFRASNSKVAIHGSIFQDNAWGVVLEETSAEIHDSLIRTSDKIGVSARKANLLINGSTISENTNGGILLEESQAKIEGNNVTNNGEWHIKVRKGKSAVYAKNNWWGKDDPAPAIIGPVEIHPMLNEPIDIYQNLSSDF